MQTFPTADARLAWVRQQLATNATWAIRALLDTFARQTYDEQAAERTSHENGVGFGGRDSEILSSFAKQVLNWQRQQPADRRFPAPLSAKQLGLVHRLMPKYAKQLIAAHVDRFDHDYPVVKVPKASTSNKPVGPAQPDQAVDAARAAAQRTRAWRERLEEKAAINAADRAHEEKVYLAKIDREHNAPGYSADEIDMGGRPKLAFNPDTATF